MRFFARVIASAVPVAVAFAAASLHPSATVKAQAPTPTPVPIPRPTPGPTPGPMPTTSPTVETPTLRILGPATVNSGAVVRVEVMDGPGHRTDWIGLYAVDAHDLDSLRWRYLNGSTIPPARGLTSATVGFELPRIPGRYEFRLFGRGTHRRLASSGVVVAR